MPEINFGFNPQKQQRDEDPELDWKFGADIPDIAPEVNGFVGAVYAWASSTNGIYVRVSNPINHCVSFIKKGFEKYLPGGELQNKGGEKMDCVMRGHHNKIEEKLNYAYENNRLSQPTINFFMDNGYIKDGKFALNDRIGAILSGTTANGNSLKAPIETICSHESGRGIGIFPKNIVPQLDMTFAEYHDKNCITQEMLDLGKKSLEYISINYLHINSSQFNELGGDIKWLIFDNYIDPVDGDWIKQLAPDYNLYPTAYELKINDLKPMPQENNYQIELYQVEGDPKVYELWILGDKKYHHIDCEPTAKDKYGNDYAKYIQKVSYINPEDISYPIGDRSLLSIIKNLFTK